MTNAVRHFAIHADDVDRAKAFTPLYSAGGSRHGDRRGSIRCSAPGCRARCTRARSR